MALLTPPHGRPWSIRESIRVPEIAKCIKTHKLRLITEGKNDDGFNAICHLRRQLFNMNKPFRLVVESLKTHFHNNNFSIIIIIILVKKKTDQF